MSCRPFRLYYSKHCDPFGNAATRTTQAKTLEIKHKTTSAVIGGVAEQIGSPLDVYDAPASVFVAGFIGSPAMNFLPGTAAAAEGRSVAIDGSNQALPVARPASASGDRFTVGIRPEHLEPVPPGDAAALELAVDLVEALGADSLVHGQLTGGGEGPAVTVRVDGAMRVTAGDTLHLAVATKRIHFFDSGNGRRLV